MGATARPASSKLTSAPIERRERRPVSMRGYAVRADGSNHEILLLDLSYEGCGIATLAELEAGEQIKLSVLRRGGIDAEVRWCSGGKAGLVFALEEEGAREHCKRNAERITLTAEVIVRRLGKTNFTVSVFDASPAGCKIDLVERPAVGEFVLVRFESLEPLQAEVCWIDGHVAGLRFERPMHPAVFDLLVERLTG